MPKDEMQRKLSDLAKASKRFCRAADKLINAHMDLPTHSVGSNGYRRVWAMITQRSAEYDRLQAELMRMVEVHE